MATPVPPSLNVVVARAVTARTKTVNVPDVRKSASVPVSITMFFFQSISGNFLQYSLINYNIKLYFNERSPDSSKKTNNFGLCLF